VHLKTSEAYKLYRRHKWKRVAVLSCPRCCAQSYCKDVAVSC